MKKSFLLIVLSISVATVFGASKYWVGGASGSWANPSSWSLSSGGAAGAEVPKSADNVYFDASGKNANPTVTSIAYITVASITITKSNVTFGGPTTQKTTATGVVAGSNTVTLSAANDKIVVGQTVSLYGSNVGTLAPKTTVEAISGTTLTLSEPATASSSAAGTLNFGQYKITATDMTIDGSQVTFTEAVTVNNSLTLKGTAATITTIAPGGRPFTLGNGKAFTLIGNSPTNYFSGNKTAYYEFNTTSVGSGLTVYFNPVTISLGGIGVAKGDLTIGNNLNTQRIILNKTNSTNRPQLILGSNVSFGFMVGGSSQFTSDANGGVVDASAPGSKFIITGKSPTVNAATGRIFKENTTINEFEYNSPGNTFTLAFPITVNKLILSAGIIENSETNNITLAKGGSVTKIGGNLLLPIGK